VLLTSPAFPWSIPYDEKQGRTDQRYQQPPRDIKIFSDPSHCLLLQEREKPYRLQDITLISGTLISENNQTNNRQERSISSHKTTQTNQPTMATMNVTTRNLVRIPPDKINLRLILVSGKTKDFLFDPNYSASEIAQYVFDHWPQDWTEEAVPRAEILRLIYQGRFLHGNVTLAALSLPTGRTCVMHLVQREHLPDSGGSQESRLKSKERSTGCCSMSSCSVL